MVSECPCAACELIVLHYSGLEFLSGWIPRSGTAQAAVSQIRVAVIQLREGSHELAGCVSGCVRVQGGLGATQK